ncbi:MAG: MFS transporter [Legionellaceae bacterium]|nr:MFS transporter [Legionellaceae bacterium]
MKCSVPTGEGCRWEAVQPWLVCFSASLFFFYQFIQGNMFASLGDHVMRDFGIEADKMVYLSSIYYFANVAFLIAAGIVLDRCSIKKTLVLSMLICVISTFLLAYTQSFYLALTYRFIAGVTSAFCFLGPIRLATRWFPPKKMALITGAIVTMAMCGGLVAQYPITAIALHVGWRGAVLNVAWLGVLIFVLMLWWIQERPEAHQDPVHETLPMWTTWKACLSRQPIFSGLYTSLMNLPIAVLGAAMGKLYLMQRLGATQAEASWVNGMLFFGAMLGGPLFGFFSDKLGRRLFPMKLGALFSLMTVLCILYAPVSAGVMAVLFFLLGLVTAAQVISYVLVAESSSPVMVATALSVVSLFTQGGYLVYQNIFSKILVKCGGVELIGGTPVYPLASYQTAALILPAAFLISLLLTFGLKETFAKPQH